MRTIDSRNLPPVTPLSADMTQEQLEAARAEALANAAAAGNPDLAGSYLARAGAIQIQMLLKQTRLDA